MSAARETGVEAFAAAARDAGAVVVRTPPGDATAAIADAIREPAVGAALPFDAVALPDGVAVDPDREALTGAASGVTAAVLGIAPYGSVVVPMTDRKEGPVSLYPERQVAVVRETDLVADVATALERLERRVLDGDGDAVFVTGPSATGDMGELVTGVHGPAELHVVVIEDER